MGKLRKPAAGSCSRDDDGTDEILPTKASRICEDGKGGEGGLK